MEPTQSQHGDARNGNVVEPRKPQTPKFFKELYCLKMSKMRNKKYKDSSTLS